MSAPAKVYTAIGLMSGTSLDGVDAALIETDGHGFVKPLAFVTQPYDTALREALRACFGKAELDADGREAERAMTMFHVKLVQELRAPPGTIIGFHGQTVLHEPANGITVQIGDAALLAAETGLDVVHDFRSADVAAGGQGAPLAPPYHSARAKASGLEEPLVILNIGG
ncbi:MAG TPA: anhydro-N-acetylmuramic acid kinase, partial [Alphaproteobacteria bacterium]|nr:anhydro-N-acetylmuramic acid kinase [Alphaproteobacteria bacterium]